MNSIKKIISAGFFIFCYFFSQGQQLKLSPAQTLDLQKRTMNNSSFIIEGVAMKQQCYYGKHTGILTCTVLKITKIFKGSPQIKLGSIKIITKQGGRVGGDLEQISDGGPGIYEGLTYIIFGNQANLSELSSSDTLVVDNSVSIKEFDLISITNVNNTKLYHKGDPAANWNNYSFQSLDSLYAYLKENGSLVIQQEVTQPQH